MTNNPTRVDQFLTLAKTYLPDMVSFLQDLVRIPSVNGRQPEIAVAQRIAAEAEKLQLQAHFSAIDPQRPNVLVQYGYGPAGFVLVGHMDTVAEGTPEAWSHPPFEPTLEMGRLFGRGSADNKAGIACSLYTLALLRDHHILDPEKVRITLAGVVDEESGASSPLGVRHLLNQGLLQPAKGAIYTYAGDIICIGHRGLLRVLLCAAGKSIHTGSPAWSRGEEGINAVTGLSAILVALEKLDLPAPAHPAFEGMRCRMTPGTLFRGGEFESMVPAQAEALIDIRLMPGQSAQDVLESIQQVVCSEIDRRPGLSVSLEIKNNLPGVVLSPDTPLVRTAAQWARQMTGRDWPVAGAGPANEGYMLIQAGIPTLCGFGPTGGNAHAPDEWVEIDSLAQTLAMYAGIITDTTQS